jgi:hypothetical protein
MTDRSNDPESEPAERITPVHELCDASAITLDIDWAPDWCIEQACRTLATHGARATFFVTHRSPVIDELLDDDRFEVGIHPNFLAHTTQGCSTEEILDHCLAIAPDARAIRTHSLFQSIPLLQLLTSKYAQIDVDLSLLLLFHPDLRPVDWHYFRSGGGLIRLPYYWQDDVAAGWPGWRWDGRPPESAGLKIFDFHAVLLALNISDLQGYVNLKHHMGSRPLYTAAQEDFEPFVHKGLGDKHFLENVITHFGASSFRTVSEIAAYSQRISA